MPAWCEPVPCPGVRARVTGLPPPAPAACAMNPVPVPDHGLLPVLAVALAKIAHACLIDMPSHIRTSYIRTLRDAAESNQQLHAAPG